MTEPIQSPLRQGLRRLAQALRSVLGAALALLILFEEWGWWPLQAWLARLASWPPLRALEALIQRLPPGPALALLALPALSLLPVKLAALALMAGGQPLAGLAVIVAAKLLGTAVVARLYQLTQPALLQWAWFARMQGWWLPWKVALLARVRSSRVWRQSRVFKRALRRRWASVVSGAR